MKYDYLSKQPFQPRKLWWDERIQQDEHKRIYSILKENPELAGSEFVQMGLSEKEFFKHSLLTPFGLDFEAYQNGKIIPQDTILLTIFRKGETPYFATLKDIKIK